MMMMMAKNNNNMQITSNLAHNKVGKCLHFDDDSIIISIHYYNNNITSKYALDKKSNLQQDSTTISSAQL